MKVSTAILGLSGAALVSTGVVHAAPEPVRLPVTPEYVSNVFFKGCLGALSGSVDLANEKTAGDMGMDVIDRASVFVRHKSGEGAVVLGRRDLLGSQPKQELSLNWFKVSKKCEIEYYGPAYLDLKAVLQRKTQPLVPASTSDSNYTYDEYTTETSPSEVLKIKISARHPRSASLGLKVTAELAAKP